MSRAGSRTEQPQHLPRRFPGTEDDRHGSQAQHQVGRRPQTTGADDTRAGRALSTGRPQGRPGSRGVGRGRGTLRLKILLVTSMVPQAEGGGAIPVLLDAQLTGLRKRHSVTLISAVGDEPGEAEAAAALAASGLDARFADRRQPRSPAARWRRRGRLAGTWAFTPRPWRSVWFAVPGVQRLVDRAVATEDFDVIAVEDSAMSALRLPEDVPAVLTEHEVLRPRPVDWRLGWPSKWPSRAMHELDWRRRPRFQRVGWRRFTRVLAFTRRDAEAIAALAPEVASRVRISPFGTILPPPADPKREIPGTLLFVGSFTHQPNRDTATWLARQISPRSSPVTQPHY